jgi:hypothetical protein
MQYKRLASTFWSRKKRNMHGAIYGALESADLDLQICSKILIMAFRGCC